MANYSLVLDTKFNPFSYSEMLAPVAAATQAHQAVEEEFGNLATKADVWNNMANEQTDPQAYRMYKGYSNDLKARAEDLMRNGLNASSRKGMLDMRARYSKEIAPIEVAYKRREELSAEQRKALAQNPTMLYQRMANTMSLDDFIKNPSLDYGQQYSGALITQQVANAAANIAKEARDSEEGKRRLRKILPYQYELVQQNGFSRDAVMKAILNSPDANQVLTGLVKDAIHSSGVGGLDSNGNMSGEGWGDLATRRRAYDYAVQGLYHAIGQTNYSTVTDSFNMQNELDRLKHIREKQGQLDQTKRNNRLNPLALRSREELDEANKSINQYLNAGYFTQGDNGHLVMTEKGKKAYFKLIDEQITKKSGAGKDIIASTVSTGRKLPSQFRVFMDKLGAQQFIGKHASGEDVIQPGNMGILFQKYIDANKPTSYDTYHSTEYDRQLDSSYGDDYLKQIKSAASGNKLSIVEFKDRQWKQVDEIDTEDLKNYTVTNVRYSKHGNTAILQQKDGSGTPIRVKLPAGIHLGAESNIQTAIRNADDYGHILHTGKRPRTTIVNRQLVLQRDRQGRILYTDSPLTIDDIMVFQNKQDEALSDMGSYGSQIVVASKTKDEEYYPFNF